MTLLIEIQRDDVFRTCSTSTRIGQKVVEVGVALAKMQVRNRALDCRNLISEDNGSHVGERDYSCKMVIHKEAFYDSKSS